MDMKLTLVLLLALLSGASANQTPERLAVDTRHRLFLDDRVCAGLKDMRLIQGVPKKHPANPIIGNDYPWESRAADCYMSAYN